MYVSKTLKNKAIVWLSKMVKGINNILTYVHEGVKKWQEIETQEK